MEKVTFIGRLLPVDEKASPAIVWFWMWSWSVRPPAHPVISSMAKRVIPAIQTLLNRQQTAA
jgi:hypothetical protein